MITYDLERLANSLVAGGKGILAADESVATRPRRFDAVEIHFMEQSRRRYREMLLTTPGVAAFISGVIMRDEAIRQKSSNGTLFTDVLDRQGIVPGIRVDTGATPMAGSPGELVTEGLDGLRDRLAGYRDLGARFAKWRAVISVSDVLPTARCVSVNSHTLARYAALCQEAGLVPIVEQEVSMNGSHTIERCEEVTSGVLSTLFRDLVEQRVSLEYMLLTPNVVTAGKACPRQATVPEVAAATLRCLRRHVPAAVPGLVFPLSGSQSDALLAAHLNAINRLPGPRPWKIGFSYGLQDVAPEAWRERDENVKTGEQTVYHRGRCHTVDGATNGHPVDGARNGHPARDMHVCHPGHRHA